MTTAGIFGAPDPNLVFDFLVLVLAGYRVSVRIYHGAGVESVSVGGFSEFLATRERSNFSDRSVIKRVSI